MAEQYAIEMRNIVKTFGSVMANKNINLSVALKLGKLIQDNCKDVKVLYTRQKDVGVKWK